MKNENLVLSEDAYHFDLKFPGLQLELMQLHKVNQYGPLTSIKV